MVSFHPVSKFFAGREYTFRPKQLDVLVEGVHRFKDLLFHFGESLSI